MANPKPLPVFTESDKARFWSFVDIGGPDDCWEWKMSLFRGGYGSFTMRNQRVKAHRVSWALCREQPKDLVLHKCDNPKCVNPNHLFEGSWLDNAKDCSAKGRRATGDKNGTHIYPERLTRGEQHWMRRHPEASMGVRNNAAKLTENDVLDIRILKGFQAKQKDIASAFGINQSQVSSIQRRDSWNHIP
jgi:hypothetical protein